MPEFALTPKTGNLAAVANVAIFTAFTDSTGAVRARARFTLPDASTTARVISVAVDPTGAPASKLIAEPTLNPGETVSVDVILKTSGDELEAWQDAGTDVEYAVDGVDGLATS